MKKTLAFAAIALLAPARGADIPDSLQVPAGATVVREVVTSQSLPVVKVTISEIRINFTKIKSLDRVFMTFVVTVNLYTGESDFVTRQIRMDDSDIHAAFDAIGADFDGTFQSAMGAIQHYLDNMLVPPRQ